MKIVVLLKQTPDTEAKIRLTEDKSAIVESDIKFVINPYDEYAIEEALKIKDQVGTGEVIIASFGKPSVKELIVKGLAMGADRGLLIDDSEVTNTDSLGVAKVLVAAIKAEQADLVLCGKQGIDADNMHVGVMAAELLGWPHVNVAGKVELDGSQAKVEREVEGGQVEVYQLTLPAVIGANKSLNSPRYASLPGIMKAKKKPFETKNLGDLGLDPAALKAKVLITSFENPPEKPAGQVFKDGTVEERVSKVVQLLREEAKII